MNAFLTSPVRRTVAAGIASGTLMLVYGLFLSREHITHVGYWIGLSPLEAETLFIFIDVLALFGKMLMSKHLSAKTRRIGRNFLMTGGLLSLACNVVSGFIGGGFGPAAYGAFVVGMIAALEYAVANIKAKAVRVAKVDADEAPAPAPAKTGRKHPVGCTCGVHNRRKANEDASPASPGRVPLDELNAGMAV